MLFRGDELRPHGKIVVQIPLIYPDPKITSKILLNYRMAKEVILKVLQKYNCLELSDKMYIPLAFNNEKNIVDNIGEKLLIDKINKFETFNRKTEDIKKSAQIYAEFLKSFTFGIFKGALTKNGKEGEAEKILSEITNGWREELEKVVNEMFTPIRVVIKASVNLQSRKVQSKF